MEGVYFCSLKLIYLKHPVYVKGHGMEWFRAGVHRSIKIEFRENYKNMDHVFRTRWSGQGCMNKLFIISIVMHVPKQSRIV